MSKGVPIEFPDDIFEKIQHFQNYAGHAIGWCLLCDNPIRSEADMIPGTNTHNCEPGRALDAKLAAQREQQAPDTQAAKVDDEPSDHFAYQPVMRQRCRSQRRSQHLRDA